MKQTIPTIRTMARETGALIFVFGIACIPSVGQIIALTLLILMVFGRPATTLKSLVAGTTVTLITLMPVMRDVAANPLPVALKWLLLFAACARSLMIEGKPTKIYGSLIKYWGLITGVLLLNAIFVSALPSLSGFKAISFSVGLLCVIRLSMLTTNQNSEMLLYISEMGSAVFILSVPLLPFDIGWARMHGAYFNGILLHSQALGIFLVMTGAASFAAAFRLPHLQRVLIVSGLAQWSLIYFTKCRTALFAIVLCGIVYIIEIFVRGEKKSRIQLFTAPIITLALLGLMLITMVSSGAREGIASFVQKGDELSLFGTGDRTDVLQSSSRGAQIFDDVDLIEEHPIFGYGFGVNKDSEQFTNVSGNHFFGIPLSAPIEQGFLPLATVAQIGIVGAPIIVAFIFSLYGFARRGSAEDAALFAAAVGVTFGEMIFYSFGSEGLLLWVIMVLIAVSGSIPRIYVKAVGK